MIYNFRFDRHRRETVLRRLQEQSELCQGWGGGSEANHDLRKESFRERTVETYDMESTNVATNLTRMRDFDDGDRLVTPHLPKEGTVSVHEVEGAFPECYNYVDEDDTHLNHRIQIRRSWGLSGNISANHWKLAPWKAKLPWYRLPIITIEEVGRGFREIIGSLQEDASQEFPESDLSRYLNEVESELVSETQSHLERIAPSGTGISFEEIALHLLRAEGYAKKDQHRYDGEGGDVDFVLTRDEVSPFETDETVLFVQVKKHTGETGVGAVEQVVQMMEREPDAGGCVITLADRFSDDAQDLAERNGIALIDGPTTCQLLMQRLISPSENEL